MLDTNLQHLSTDEEIRDVLRKHENVMICCGRMGPMCIPVYRAMEQLQTEYPHVAFRDMEFDIPAAALIKDLPECTSFMSLPFTVYFKSGTAVAATTSIQNTRQIKQVLDERFGASS